MFSGTAWCMPALHHLLHWGVDKHLRECQDGFLECVEGGWRIFTAFWGLSLGNLS